MKIILTAHFIFNLAKTFNENRLKLKRKVYYLPLAEAASVVVIKINQVPISIATSLFIKCRNNVHLK